MRVLITGGTGFVGRAVVRQLRDTAHEITLLTRSPSSVKEGALAGDQDIRIVTGNILDQDSVSRAFDDVEAVIHLVGIISEIGENTFDRAHREATENVLRVAAERGVRRYVHMSALGTRPDAVSKYHQTKWAAEEAVRASGLDWTIFRPSLIFGPEDQFVNLFATMSRYSPFLPIMGSGNGRLQPVSVEDVAACFAKAIDTPRAIRETFDLCGPEVLTFSEILDAISETLGRRRMKLRIPLPLARFQAAGLETVYPAILGKAAPLNRDQLIMLEEDNVGDPKAAEALFDRKFAGFREGIGFLKNRARPTTP